MKSLGNPRPAASTASSDWRRVIRAALGRPALVLLSVGLVAACGGSGETSSAVPVEEGDLGESVYASSCASCHGAELQGTEKGPSHLSIVYEPGHHGDESFRSAIANGSPQHHWGFGDMPAVDGLSDEEVDAVIAYIRSEQERQGFQQ